MVETCIAHFDDKNSDTGGKVCYTNFFLDLTTAQAAEPN